MNTLQIGIVSDLRNYKDYFRRFSRLSPSKILEIHLLAQDLDDSFGEKISEFRQFVVCEGITHLAFHSIDNIIQAVLFEEEGYEQSFPKFSLMVDVLKKLSNDLQQEVLLIVHQGIKLPRSRIHNLDGDQLRALRDMLLRKAGAGYAKLNELVKGSRLVIALENSPPSCASDESEHFIDLCFEDFAERLGDSGAFVLDISHAAMCIEYFKQDNLQFKALELLLANDGKPPISFRSLRDYIKAAAKNIRWIHFSDATGFLGKDEGQVIGVPHSAINYGSVIRTLRRLAPHSPGVLEIVDGHRDFELIEASFVHINALSPVKIGDKTLGDGSCFVVAEVASSHCGNKETLKDIIQHSVHAGADAVQLQIFAAHLLSSQHHPGLADLKKIELPHDVWKEIIEYAHGFSTNLIAQVFDEESADIAEPYVDAFSVHSSDINNPFLLRHVALKGKPVLLHIGGSMLKEIAWALDCVEDCGTAAILVYGIQNFPTEPKDVNLKRIYLLKETFGVPIGYHDHTRAGSDVAVDIAIHAFAFGACIVEKHITNSREKKGFDYISSLNPEEFAIMVKKIRAFEHFLGDSSFALTPADLEYRKKMKKFIVAVRDIKKGDVIGLGDIAFKRVTHGIFFPTEYHRVVGKRAANDIASDLPITNEDIEHKIVILVPVRMKSTRLPKKAILDIGGDTSIGLMIERLKNSKNAEVILCTSTVKEDDILVNIAEQKGIKWFRGSPDDVMERFILCAEREGADVIVRATGDNPLMDPELIDRQIDFHIKHNADYTCVEDVPLGVNAEVFNLDVIKTARASVRNPKDTEYMTWFLKDPSQFKVVVMDVNNDEKGNFRVTLDTPADLEVIRKIYIVLSKKNKVFSTREMVKFLNEHGEVAAINVHYQQLRAVQRLNGLQGSQS